MKKKTIIILVVLGLVFAGLTIWSCGYIFIYHNIGCIRCFTVNDEGEIYLGCENRIFVIDNGEVQKVIDTPAESEYNMSIKDNMLLVNTVESLEYYDLDDEFIKKTDIPIKYKEASKVRCFDSYGNEYRLKNRGGACYITKKDISGNKSVYYKIPTESAVANILFPITFFFFFFIFMFLVGYSSCIIYSDSPRVILIKSIYNSAKGKITEKKEKIKNKKAKSLPQ